MLRKIVSIDEDKCNGCGLCVNACHEDAIELIDGKARLISDSYCDGLGDCLPECPTGAIEIIERDAAAYDEETVLKRIAEKNKPQDEETLACGCPGSAARSLHANKSTKSDSSAQSSAQAAPAASVQSASAQPTKLESQLNQWPVQLNLVSTKAPYLENANLLVAADCTAYAYANFHNDFIKDHITLIGCPKLDDVSYYAEKLTEILSNNNIKSISVVRMSVPCCGGIVNAIKQAMLNSQTIVPYNEYTITPEGEIL